MSALSRQDYSETGHPDPPEADAADGAKDLAFDFSRRRQNAKLEPLCERLSPQAKSGKQARQQKIICSCPKLRPTLDWEC